MNKPALLLALATTLAASSALGAGAGREIQMWVDENGVTHYGDAPPPEAVKQGTTVLNKQGVAVRQIPRQLSPEEAAAARQQQEEASRRRAQDSFLLSTYTRATDIERARDDQLALIDSHIELARGSLASSEQKLESLRDRMANFRPYSATATRRVPDALAAEVVHALGERRSMQETVSRHEQRKTEVRAKFDADIARYKELISRPSIR